MLLVMAKMVTIASMLLILMISILGRDTCNCAP